MRKSLLLLIAASALAVSCLPAWSSDGMMVDVNDKHLAEAGLVAVDVSMPENSSESYLQYDDLASQAASKPIAQNFELKLGTYVLQWDREMDVTEVIDQLPKFEREQAAAKIKKMPNLVSSEAKIEAWEFDGSDDDGLMLFVVDESKGTGKGFDTAYIDYNRNRDLTDDAPVTWDGSDDEYQKSTHWVDVQSHQGWLDGQHENHPIPTRLLMMRSRDWFYPQLQRKACWKGTVDSSDGKVEIALVDCNCNGIWGDPAAFDSKFEITAGDNVFIDINSIGKVIPRVPSKHMLSLNPVTIIANRLYKIQAEGLGDKITIAPYTGPAGKLLISGNLMGKPALARSLVVIGPTGEYDLKDFCDKPMVFPAGKFMLMNCTLGVTGSGARQSDTGAEPKRVFRIDPGKQTTLNLGGDKLHFAIKSDKKTLVLTPKSTEPIDVTATIGNMYVGSVLPLDSEQNAKVKFFDAGRKLVNISAIGYT